MSSAQSPLRTNQGGRCGQFLSHVPLLRTAARSCLTSPYSAQRPVPVSRPLTPHSGQVLFHVPLLRTAARSCLTSPYSAQRPGPVSRPLTPHSGQVLSHVPLLRTAAWREDSQWKVHSHTASSRSVASVSSIRWVKPTFSQAG